MAKHDVLMILGNFLSVIFMISMFCQSSKSQNKGKFEYLSRLFVLVNTLKMFYSANYCYKIYIAKCILT